MAEGEKFIRGAIEHPGYLTRAAKASGGWDEEHQRIKPEWIAEQTHSKNPHRAHAARLAETLGRLRRHHHGG